MNEQQQAMMDEVFRTYCMAYMQKFTSMFRGANPAETDAAIQEWKEAFAEHLSRSKLTLKQVKSAIQAAPSRFPEYPPTFGEFTGLCRAFSDPVIKLPEPRTHGSEKSRAAMSAMLDMLTKKMTGRDSQEQPNETA